jgi:5-methylcytosine-specific restriction endonuclease McrA
MKIKRDPLDTLFSRYIRMKAGWKCERCGSTPDKRGLHCHHAIHHRRKLSTRWDEDNCISVCLGCHQYFEENDEYEQDFMIKRLGQERYDLVKARGRYTGKTDRDLIKLYLKEKIKELECVEDIR